MVGLYLYSVNRVVDWHSGKPGKDLAEHAFAIWAHMGNHHEGDACIDRHGLEQPLQGIDAAGGRSDADNGEAGILACQIAVLEPDSLMSPIAR